MRPPHWPAASFRVLGFAAALTTLSSTASWAHWSHTAGALTVFAGTGSQYVSSAADGMGGVVMSWLDSSPGSHYDLYAQRVGPNGAVRWTASGVPVSTLTANINDMTVASDGAGGLFVAWSDDRAGAGDFAIFAQYFDSTGTALWTTDGVAVTSGAGVQTDVQIVPDGAGGLILGWSDTRSGNIDVYAQRLNAAGAALWTAGGLGIVTLSPSNQNGVRLAQYNATGGIGGAGFVWNDFRSGATADLYYQVVNAAGTPLLIANGVVVCNAANGQSVNAMVSTGAMATVVWADNRGASQDIYAMRIRMDIGGMTWAANGVAVCAATLTQTNPKVVLEPNLGIGNSVIAWTDGRAGNNDVYAQRFNSSGVAQWAANGVPVISSTPNQVFDSIDDDGGTGSVIAWRDFAPITFTDLRVQHLDANGNPLWTANGVSMQATATVSQAQVYWIDNDNTILVWSESRPGGDDVFTNRIERFGYPGDPAPAIESVRDVPHDQGGAAKVSWYASYLDVFPSYGIASYRVWRSVPVLAAQAAIARGERTVTSSADVAARSRALLARVERAPSAGGAVIATTFWENIGTQPAIGLSGYSFVVAMPFDSLPGANPYTPFMIEARTSGVPFWLSDVDSGYSVDNLAPPAPAPFAGTYSAGVSSLHWGPSGVADFGAYRLYRGATPGFIPGPGNLVTALPDTSYEDPAGALFYYKLSAVDVHGNESPFALVLPTGAAEVGEALPTRLTLAPPAPAPARDRTTLRFGLPAAGRVTLEVLDVSGRRVALLIDGAMSAGRHSLAWSLAANGRSLDPGLYWIRLRAGGGATALQKLAVVR